MQHKKKRVTSILLCITITAGLIAGVMPTHKAHAFFGAAIVSDPIVEANTTAMTTAAGTTAGSTVINTASTVAGWLDTAWRVVQDTLLNTLLANLKKRLLDEITNETIQWIQTGNNNGPIFTGNFGEVFTTAADQAAGDVLQQIGAGQLCTGIPQKLINLQLAQPQPLNQTVSCTLSQTVGNIEQFKQNFQNGGWAGYQDLLMPQNNQYGLEILTEQALENQVQQNTQASVLQQQVNVGFNGEQCLTYRLISTTTQQPIAGFGDSAADSSGNAPALPPGYDQTNAEWKCVQEKTTTPGRTIADNLNQALGSNINFIVNSNDISSVLGAVLDAAFNRLVKTGINGIQTGLAGLSRDNTTGSGLTETSDIAAAAKRYSDEASNAIASQSNALLAPLNNASSSINTAMDTLASASSSVAYLFQTTQALSSCLATINASSTDLDWASSTLTLASSTYPVQIADQTSKTNQELDVINGLFTQAQNIQQDPTQMTQSFKDDITNAYSTANGLEKDANQISNTVQSTLTDAQNRLSVCVTIRGSH